MGSRIKRCWGVTGSGKTFTIANVIADLQRPTMVLAPNKTLAAQLYGEMKEFSRRMPSSISSPTTITISRKPTSPAQIPSLEKDASVNEHIERDALVGDQSAARAARRGGGGVSLGYLRPRRPGPVPEDDAAPDGRDAD